MSWFKNVDKEHFIVVNPTYNGYDEHKTSADALEEAKQRLLDDDSRQMAIYKLVSIVDRVAPECKVTSFEKMK